MAKFCTKCGKPLEEGKTCSCIQTVNQEVITTSNMFSNIGIEEGFFDCINVLKNIFIKPFEVIKEFVCENKLVAGIIMIILAAISSGLYKIAILKSIYLSSLNSFNANDFSSLFQNAFSGGFNSTKPEYLKEFFTTFATDLVEYALIIAVGYWIISKILKGTASWKQIITAVAVSLSVVIIGNIINSGLVFVDADFINNVRSYVTSFTSISSILILGSAVNEVAGIDKNKLFVSVCSMLVLATIVIDVVKKLFA